MFHKKCSRCKNKVSRKFTYCPYCGFPMNQKEKDGLLDNIEEQFSHAERGDGDEIERLTREIGRQMGVDLGRFPFNQIVKKLSADIDKQFKYIDKEFSPKKIKGKSEVTRKGDAEIRKTEFPGGFSIQIKIGGVPQMPLQPQQQKKQPEAKPVAIAQNKLSPKQKDMLSKLPKQEPETKVRRLTDKIIYEVRVPGVKSLKDTTVNKLENSIEIKAIGKDRAYFKLIPISLPLIKYYLKEGTLFLELKP